MQPASLETEQMLPNSATSGANHGNSHASLRPTTAETLSAALWRQISGIRLYDGTGSPALFLASVRDAMRILDNGQLFAEIAKALQGEALSWFQCLVREENFCGKNFITDVQETFGAKRDEAVWAQLYTDMTDPREEDG